MSIKPIHSAGLETRKDHDVAGVRELSGAQRSSLDVLLPAPNRFQRLNQRLAATRFLAFVFRHSFPHIDRLAARHLRGRTVSAVIAGLPNILLTTTGVRSGRPRAVPLVAIPFETGVAVIATRFGAQSHPAWYHNLVADHHAIAEISGRRIPVVAEEIASGDTYDEIMRRADLVYAGFRSYRARITQRHIPVFLLRTG